MINKIDHINIIVSNLEKSVKFYTEILGFKEIRRAKLKGYWIEQVVGLENVEAEVSYIIASEGELRIELLHYFAPKGEKVEYNSIANTIGIRHVAFQVKNIYDFVEMLKNKGVKFISKPVEVPISTIKHDDGHKILCYFHDPDGVILELAEYVER